MKKIALVYDAIYPYIPGGGQKRFYEIGKQLAKKKLDVHIYGMKSWIGPDVIKYQGMTYHGLCEYKELYTKSGKRSISQALYFGINCLKLIKEDFDIIDCCGFPYFSLFSCKFVTLIKKKNLVSTWHEVWGYKYWNEYLGVIGVIGYFIEQLSSKLPNKIIAVSESTATKLKTILNCKQEIVIIENGVDFQKINTIRSSNQKTDIIFIGRLMDFKNIDKLITQIAVIKETYKDIRCLIIGDGPEKNKLELLISEYKLKKNISIIGFTTEEKIYSLLKSSKVFVLPSEREGFGMIVIEAFACGVPVLTIDYPNNFSKKLITTGENGWVVKDLKDLQIYLDKATNMKVKSKTKLKKYDWYDISEQVIRFYLK